MSLGRIKPTKTYEERTVDLTPDLLQTIQCHLTWLKTEALRRGTGEPEWLFPNEDGGPMDESRVRKAFKRALKDAKLPAFRLYDLRHTYAPAPPKASPRPLVPFLEPKSGTKTKSGTPVLRKSPICLVGRHGLEPWTR